LLIIFATLNIYNQDNMPNKQLQEQRMKGYFMQATKELLKGEGLKSINVRNIAQQAGYSYATLYNYFKDVKELVFLCVTDFQEECTAEIESKVSHIPDGIERIKSISKAYIAYFVQYPSVFNLFFIEKLGDIGQKQPTAELIYSYLDRLCEKDWQYCIAHNQISQSESELMKQELNFVACGMLLYYMNRIQPANYQEFTNTVDNQINAITGSIKN
jgi:AcrR family transcriptional regulator